MRPLSRAQYVAVALWLVVGLVVWNGVYDLVVGQGIKEYLFRQALYRAGLAPAVTIGSVMDEFVLWASFVSTIWASVILLAGLFTLRLATLAQGRPPSTATLAQGRRPSTDSLAQDKP